MEHIRQQDGTEPGDSSDSVRVPQPRANTNPIYNSCVFEVRMVSPFSPAACGRCLAASGQAKQTTYLNRGPQQRLYARDLNGIGIITVTIGFSLLWVLDEFEQSIHNRTVKRC
jgi:hypothetical protein